jgi:sugar O-acyltransferase (sialic acid O-acetyltransferase NeuD family)
LKTRVLILGAGGHAQVVADILLRMQDEAAKFTPTGYLDDDPALKGQRLLGLPVLGRLTRLFEIPHEAVLVAIGDNATRQSIFDQLLIQGERSIIARHPSAVIAPDVRIGPGTMICAGVVVNPGSTIGANVILNTGCTVGHHNHIGDHAHIAPGVHLGGGDVHIGEGTLVGIGATVMPQRQVGAWSIVSAGAVVHSDVKDGIVVAGVPARAIRSRMEDD